MPRTEQLNSEQLTADLEAAKPQLTALQEQRAGILLQDDDKAMIAHDELIAGTQRQIERLEARLAEAIRLEEEAERQAYLKAEKAKVAEGEKALKRGLELYETYAEHAQAIADIIEELQGLHTTIDTARQSCSAIGVSKLLYPYQQLSKPGEYQSPVMQWQDREFVYKLRDNLRKRQGREMVIVGGVSTPSVLAPDLTNGSLIKLPDALDESRAIVPKPKDWSHLSNNDDKAA